MTTKKITSNGKLKCSKCSQEKTYNCFRYLGKGKGKNNKVSGNNRSSICMLCGGGL